jgi:hypothetical protein
MIGVTARAKSASAAIGEPFSTISMVGASESTVTT